jgi:hypothetical protein
MSHSYKKHPYCGDHKGKKKKQIANAAIRAYLKKHPEETLQGGRYKKLYCSWEICDYYSLTSWQAYRHGYYYGWRRYFSQPLMAEEELYRQWYRYYKRK